MKILVADDHEVVREGLKQIVSKVNPFAEINEAATGTEALEMIGKERYDLAIMDISMPGKTGLDILQLLKDRNEKVPVLILSVHAEEQYAIRALRLGASGYLCKDSVYKELATAISTILNGGRYLSASLTEKLLFDTKDGFMKLPHETLSSREFQVMCMLAKGKSVNEIASDLFISNKTVSTHRMRIMTKMGMSKNADLINYALKNNMVE